VFLGGFVGMRADELVAELGDGGGEGLLHRVLGGPADFVGGLTEVAVGDEENGFEFGHGREVGSVGGASLAFRGARLAPRNDIQWLENIVR
jgi:hypothetical protein